MPPQILLRAADARPLELQDLLPADARYKLLVFAGDARDAGQLARVRAFADAVGADGAFAREVVGGAREKWLDVLTVCRTPLQDVDYTAVPPALRSHWSKCVGGRSPWFSFFSRAGADRACCTGCLWTIST